METELAIRCEGLTRTFGVVRAVDSLDLEVHRGEIMAVLGPSGCGKTTLLRLIAGFDRPQAGSIEIGGKVVSSGGVFVPPERRKVGMVFQDYALFPHMTLAKNVGYGVGKSEREARTAEVLRLVGLSGLEERYPHEISGGQAQRVALARALAPRPDIILFDEPFSNLDSRLRMAVRSEVRTILKEAGASALFVTHDQEEAFSISDRVAVMWRGRVVQTGTPASVYRSPATRDVATFVGDADFVEGRAQGGRVETELGAVPIAAGPANGAVRVMFRPENLLMTVGEGNGVVVGREFYGHDQVFAVRLGSGAVVHVRTGAGVEVEEGTPVLVEATGEAVAFENGD